MLDIFKAGLYSRDKDVVLWTCKLLTKLATEFHLKGFSAQAWDWFVEQPGGGLLGILHCINTNYGITVEGPIAVLCQFGKFNYSELFTHHLMVSCQNTKEYMRVVTGFIQPLAEYRQSRDEVISAGIIHYWIDMSCKKADMDAIGSNTPDERAAALGLLLEIWSNFSNVVEEKAEYADFIIKVAQRANRDRSENLQIVSLTLLFRLIENFASDKNPYAPIVYKTLIFALMENHSKVKIREYILANFKLVFESFSSIPPSIVIEPLIKQVSFIKSYNDI